MKFFIWRIISLLCLSCCALGYCIEPSEEKLKVLYTSLNPASLSQHLAFHELYPRTKLGKQALRDAWQLLSGVSSNQRSETLSDIPLTLEALDAIVSMVNKPPDLEIPLLLNEEAKRAMVVLSARLHHSKLKGHQSWDEREVQSLPLEEIDLARGLFLSQFGADISRILTYESYIDLMALAILARLPENASPEEKIISINAYIFDEMGFRFPPHSLYAKEIDLYTFLSSVLDSRRGVCLGVSFLYLCIAQRLGLPLEMITPPGHIYVRYRSKDKVINIETTARGIPIDSEEYLGINCRSLQQRTIKEVIGMAHFNQASVFWQKGEYEKALQAYKKAEPYMEGDPLLKELMGYALILTGKRESGEKLLREIQHKVPDFAIVKNSMAEDYMEGKVDAEGIAALFKKVDEDRQSILDKKRELEKVLSRFPRFRSGILSLSITWLQLHRAGEALEALNQFLTIDKGDPEVHYYLSVLYAQRRDYPQAWNHLKQTEAILKAHHHFPKIIKELRRELLLCCPE